MSNLVDINFMNIFAYKHSKMLLMETFSNSLEIDRKNTKAMAHTTSPNEVGGVVRVLPFAKKEPFLIDRTLPSMYPFTSCSRSGATCAHK